METSRVGIWLKAFRLRTLPLSLAGIVTGGALAQLVNRFDGLLFGLAIATVLFLQILSNLANDLGDSLKGTDNAQRVGPERAVQSGQITIPQMKRAVLIFAVLSLLAGIPLAYLGTRELPSQIEYTFYGLALLCVLAAVGYTLGKKAYGYLGLGDLFVFLFFGLLSVQGIYVLMTKQFDWLVFLPASAIGLLSVAVLNLNNMRDIENDEKCGKNTLVVRMGFRIARVYHTFLIIAPALLLSVFAHLTGITGFYFGLVIYAVLIPHLIRVWKVAQPRELDKELKIVALSTFLLSLLIGSWSIL